MNTEYRQSALAARPSGGFVLLLLSCLLVALACGGTANAAEQDQPVGGPTGSEEAEFKLAVKKALRGYIAVTLPVKTSEAGCDSIYGTTAERHRTATYQSWWLVDLRFRCDGVTQAERVTFRCLQRHTSSLGRTEILCTPEHVAPFALHYPEL